MRYLAFPWWMMKLSKCQDGYFNQHVIIFGLKYDTHSLPMHPESPCRSAITLIPKLLVQRYALRLVFVPCWYFTCPLPFLQPILPTPLSHISSVAVPHIRFWCIIPVVLDLCHHSHPLLSSPLIFYSIPIIPEQWYALRLVVVSCQYLSVGCHTSNPFHHLFRPTSHLLPSKIFSNAIPVVLHIRQHARPMMSSLLTLSTIHIILHLRCASIFILLRSLSHYLISFCILHSRCLSTFSNRIFSSLYVVLYYTNCSALLHTTFFTLFSDLLT